MKLKFKDLLSKEVIEKIEESSGLGSMSGAKHKKGYVSPETTTAQSDYDIKSTDHDTKVTAYDTAVAAVDATKRYRKAGFKKGTYTYSATPSKGYSTNPVWTSWNTDILGTGNAKRIASTSKDTAQTKWDSSIESDRQATIGTTPPSAGGGMRGKKGKTAEKGKNKKKKG